MKKIWTCVMSVIFALTMVATATGCSQNGGEKQPLQVTVEVAKTATAVCGTDYKVPDAVVTGVQEYGMEITVAATAGGTVNYNEETKSFYAKNLGAPAYIITYTATYTDGEETKTAVGVTELSTTDGEKPTISAPDYVTGVRGGKAEIPQASVVDNSGEKITATHVVKDDAGTVVETLKENGKEYVQISQTAKWYSVLYSASDSSGNVATEHECKIWIRNSVDEVEFFDTEELVDVDASSAVCSVVAAASAPAGGVGNVLKVAVPEKNDQNDGYVAVTVRNLGITDFTNVTKLKMRVYSTIALSNYAGWHGGNSICLGKLDGAASGKSVAANTWTDLVWNRAEVQEMFDGKTVGGYMRPVVDDVNELRLEIDNAGWWGEQSEADGGGEQWLSQTFDFYIDSIEVQQMDLNWTPRSYETETATVYEINTFNDEARFELVSCLYHDSEKFKVGLSDEYSVPFDPANPEEDNMSLKVELTAAAAEDGYGYPRFLCSFEKLAKVLPLDTLPDNAVFKMSVHVASIEGNMGDDGLLLKGDNNIVFFEKGNNTEKKPDLQEGLWHEAGAKFDVATTVANMKEKSIDLGNLDKGGFFFYATTEWDGNFSMVLYFDNFRIEVPKA